MAANAAMTIGTTLQPPQELLPLCEVCKKNPSIGIGCTPGVPVSSAYCSACLRANAHPWHILVANTAILGGLEYAALWWIHMVDDTCKHLGKTREQFEADVAKVTEEMKQAENTQFNTRSGDDDVEDDT